MADDSTPRLVNAALTEANDDIQGSYDLSALEELFRFVPRHLLFSYLSEPDGVPQHEGIPDANTLASFLHDVSRCPRCNSVLTREAFPVKIVGAETHVFGTCAGCSLSWKEIHRPYAAVFARADGSGEMHSDAIFEEAAAIAHPAEDEREVVES